MSAALIFLDTETLGLDPDDGADPVWDFAAIRRDESGDELHLQCFVQHDTSLADRLPEPFLSDYKRRYDPDVALSVAEFRQWSPQVFASRPHIVGAVPDFDTAGLRHLLGVTRSKSPWHYHIIDVETLALGFLHGLAKAGSDDAKRLLTLNLDDSEVLSRAVGVDPDKFERHTAMGDVRWAMAIYDAVMADPDA